MELAQIKPFDLYDFMAGHVRLTTKGESLNVLHINGRDLYFSKDGSMDGTGAGCSPCCEEAKAVYEAQRITAPDAIEERERELIEEAGFDKADVRDACSTGQPDTSEPA